MCSSWCSVCAGFMGWSGKLFNTLNIKQSWNKLPLRVSQICSATTDADEALNKTDLLVIRCQSPDIQVPLLHRLLRASSFAFHVETVLKKIKQVFDGTTLSTVHNDLIL